MEATLGRAFSTNLQWSKSAVHGYIGLLDMRKALMQWGGASCGIRRHLSSEVKRNRAEEASTALPAVRQAA